jgi:pimeloyl-ACP methyl ester carboxylesterase
MATLLSEVEYADRGRGPALLFVPGSFGTGAGWRAVIDKIGDGYRLVTTSLLGYGATAERRPSHNPTINEQVEVLDAILDRVDAPAHVVGHSYGGLATVAHAILGRRKPASLVLVEANPLDILRAAGDQAHYDLFGAMTKVYFAEFEAGRPDAARHVIDFYAGSGAFDALPQKVRDYVVATTASNILDWASGTAFRPAPADYSAIAVPTLVVRGGDGHPAMQRIAELLAARIPRATLKTIEGGRHFLPATHAAALAHLIAAHVASVSGPP